MCQNCMPGTTALTATLDVCCFAEILNILAKDGLHGKHPSQHLAHMTLGFRIGHLPMVIC